MVANLRTAEKILDDINWNFSTPFQVGRSAADLLDVRKYHWYPATFIPEIPYTLIDVLTQPGDIVLDPFSGIGTTVFQSLVLGRIPFGTDTSTVAVELMRAFWRILHPGFNLQSVSAELRGRLKEFNPKENYFSQIDQSRARIDLLQPWYNKNTFNELLFLMLVSEGVRDQKFEMALFDIVFSSTLKAVCAQDKGWGCISDNMMPTPDQLKKARSAIRRFERNLDLLVGDAIKYKEGLPGLTKEFMATEIVEDHIFNEDIRTSKSIAVDSVDLIITSPPYPNMTDYSFSQRLSYYWFGQEPEMDVPSEIGARRKRSRKNAIESYVREMKDALRNMATFMKAGALAVFVMPKFDADNKNNSIRKEAVNETMEFLPTVGLEMRAVYERILPTKRRHHNQNWTSLEKEKIYLYQKIR